MPARYNLLRILPMLGLGLVLLCHSMPGLAEVPIVHPGAPGKPARTLTADEAIRITVTSYSPDDVAFMQDMIPHHHQALQMAGLVNDRTNNPELVDLAGRINGSQKDEIEFMQKWLQERGESMPEPAAHATMHSDHKMAGMATPEQMAELSGLKGVEFDRMFLKLMIAHHDGAVKMVEKLHEKPGSAYDPVLYEFTNDITNDQTVEIERMNALMISLSTDPRAGLAAGFMDAGETILNMEHLLSLPRPAGFYDPTNPAGLPMEKEEEDEKKKADEEEDKPEPIVSEDSDERHPLLSFSNTDMAFSGNKLVTGSYHGFNIYELQPGGLPKHISSIVCPGGQGDVSVVGNLLIMSVQETRGRIDCGLEGIAEEVSEERFRGIRIFDISNPLQPIQVGAVQTCRGSHTHSVVAGKTEKNTIIVYNSGTAGIRKEEEMEGCIDDTPGDYRTALFRIDVIEIPIDDPSKARIVHSPAVFADPEDGRLAGLWKGGDHGDDTQETRETDQCHDITVFPQAGIAAGACSGNGILFDISDPLNPKRMDVAVDTGFAYWHSATFNNDGTKVLFTDEWGGGARPRCRANDRLDWGADAIYDIVDGKLKYRGHFKMSVPQMVTENCVAHNGSIIPVPGRDIFVQAWYQGGISVIDFTDSENPVEIAFFDRGPISDEHLVIGGFWSAYWYQGRIYGTEIARGLDVFRLAASEHLSANEITAAELASQGGAFNPQTQFPVSWPNEPVIARAYIDQLKRAGSLSESVAGDLASALGRAESLLSQGSKDSGLAAELKSLAGTIGSKTSNAGSKRSSAGLAETLEQIAVRLQ